MQVIPKANRYQNQNGDPAWGTEGGKRPRMWILNPKTKRGSNPNQEGGQGPKSRAFEVDVENRNMNDTRTITNVTTIKLSSSIYVEQGKILVFIFFRIRYNSNEGFNFTYVNSCFFHNSLPGV